MFKVVCFGEVLWDNFPAGKKPGGAPMNVALHLHKQGTNSNLISSIGNDRDGEELKEFLKQEGLSTTHIQVHPQLPTGIVNVELDQQQQATYTIVAPVAWDEIFHLKSHDKLINNADAIVFGSLACRHPVSHQTLLKLLDKNRLAIFDMNLRPPHFEKHLLRDLMHRCNILKINEDELSYLRRELPLQKADTENQLAQLSRMAGTNTICLTLGSKGAMVLHNGKIYQHPGFSVTVADTVGAGDAFLASFIAGFLQDLPMEHILARACATGALVASKTGSNPEYDLGEVLKICNLI